MHFARIRAQMEHDQLFFRRPERVRVYFAVGLVSSLVEWSLLCVAGVATWRIVAFASLFLFPVVFGLTRRDRPPPNERQFTRSSILFQVHMGLRLALTGGLHSPLLPALATMIVQPVVILGPRPAGFRLWASTLAIVVLLGLLPRAIVGAPIEGWPYTALLIVAFTTSLALTGEFMRLHHRAQARATEAIVALHEERVAEAEAQSRRLQAVGRKVAHELKNPLAAIKGLVQLLARGKDNDARTQQRLEVVEGEILRMETILREYLSFARPLEDLEPEAVELDGLVERALIVVGGRAEHARVRIEAELEPVSVVADPRRVQEALLNVLTNALEATPAGGSIRVSTRAEREGATIEVFDSGRGIRPEHLERLGRSFFTTRAEGNGLGVVLVLGVVAQHGGRLHVASEAGRGTRVRIYLPTDPHPLEQGTSALTTSGSLAEVA